MRELLLVAAVAMLAPLTAMSLRAVVEVDRDGQSLVSTYGQIPDGVVFDKPTTADERRRFVFPQPGRVDGPYHVRPSRRLDSASGFATIPLAAGGRPLFGSR